MNIRVVDLCQCRKLDVAKLYAQVFGESPWLETWSLISALEVVNDPLLRWWIALDDMDHVVGFVGGAIEPRTTIATRFNVPDSIITEGMIGYKAELGVDPRLRRSGLARLLTNELLNWFRENEIKQFIVRTRPGTGNHPWYQSRLSELFVYDDGRVIFGCEGVPTL